VEIEETIHTENLVGIGSVGIDGVLDGGLVLLDGDLALAGAAGVVVVGGDASGGLGGVFGRHVDYVVLVKLRLEFERLNVV
jgi:hypothetical protein